MKVFFVCFALLAASATADHDEVKEEVTEVAEQSQQAAAQPVYVPYPVQYQSPVQYRAVPVPYPQVQYVPVLAQPLAARQIQGGLGLQLGGLG